MVKAKAKTKAKAKAKVSKKSNPQVRLQKKNAPSPVKHGGAQTAPPAVEAQAAPPAPAAGTSSEELARLDAMGLKEVPVFGTSLKLVGMKVEGKEPPSIAQRVEMAKRLTEVGPRLPKFVRGKIDLDKPAASVKDVQAAAVFAPIPHGITEEKKKIDKPQKKVAAASKKEEPKKLRGADEFLSAEGKARVKAAGDKSRAAWAEQKKSGKAAAASTKTEQKKSGKAAAASTKTEQKPAKKAGGIGGLTRKLLKEGKDTEMILKAIKADFPNAKSSAATVAWYRSQMRAEGELPKA